MGIEDELNREMHFNWYKYNNRNRNRIRKENEIGRRLETGIGTDIYEWKYK